MCCDPSAILFSIAASMRVASNPPQLFFSYFFFRFSNIIFKCALRRKINNYSTHYCSWSNLDLWSGILIFYQWFYLQQQNIFSYKEVLHNLNIYDFKSRPPDCTCASSPFMYNPPGYVNRVRVTRSIVLYVCFVDHWVFFCTFPFGHCAVCSSSIYGFWLPL